MMHKATRVIFITVLTAFHIFAAEKENSEHPESMSNIKIIYELDIEDELLSDVMLIIPACGPGDVGHERLHLSQKISKSKTEYTLKFCPHILHHADDTPPCILKKSDEQEIISDGPKITLHANKPILTDLLKEIAKKAGGTIVIKKDIAVLTVKKK